MLFTLKTTGTGSSCSPAMNPLPLRCTGWVCMIIHSSLSLVVRGLHRDMVMCGEERATEEE